jgi:hypothetical protein
MPLDHSAALERLDASRICTQGDVDKVHDLRRRGTDHVNRHARELRRALQGTIAFDAY